MVYGHPWQAQEKQHYFFRIFQNRVEICGRNSGLKRTFFGVYFLKDIGLQYVNFEHVLTHLIVAILKSNTLIYSKLQVIRAIH